MSQSGDQGECSATVERQEQVMATASTPELDRDPRWNRWLKSGRAPQPAPRELGRGGVGGKSTMLRGVARAPPPEGKEGVARVGGVPSCHTRRFLAPTRRRPSGRTTAARSLSTPPLPAQSPKRIVRRLRASGAEPTTLQLRGGRESASRAPLIRD